MSSLFKPLLTFFDSHSPVLFCVEVSCKLSWSASANSRYVYKLINSVTSLIPYPQKEEVDLVTLAQILHLAEALKACHCCKEVCIEKCETHDFTQFGQCTIAESYMDSSTPPGNSIVLRFCSNCVNLAFNCVCPPTSTSICTRREKVWNVHRSVSTCQVIVLWMHLTHTEVQEFFVTEIFQKSCCAIAFDFWSRPKNWHLCHHTDSSYGWDLDTKLFSNIVRSYALCTYST